MLLIPALRTTQVIKKDQIYIYTKQCVRAYLRMVNAFFAHTDNMSNHVKILLQSMNLYLLNNLGDAEFALGAVFDESLNHLQSVDACHAIWIP